MPGKITEKTTILEAMINPKAKGVLAKYNLPCLSCPMAQMEIDKLKLGEVCEMYGLNLKGLLKELNGL